MKIETVSQRAKVFLSLCFLLTACNSVIKRSGDLNPFLLKELNSYGAQIPHTNGLSPIKANWTYQRDSNGFELSVDGNHFVEIDGFFKQLYGTPSISEDANLKGYPQRVYKPETIGVGLQYFQTPGGVKILCVKHISQWKN